MTGSPLAVSSGGGRVLAAVGAGVFGLVIGSFLNVVVYRVPRGLSVVRPGSFCPSCHSPIRGLDNVPVLSWVVLGGRCRRCGEPISARYPVVEAITGAVFALVGAGLGAHWGVPGMCVLAAALVASVAIELDGLGTPAPVALIGAALGTALLAAAAGADRRWGHLGATVLGAVIATGAALVAPRLEGEHRAGGEHAGAWALVPAGAVLGWAAPVGAVVGVPVIAAALLASWASGVARRRRIVAVAAALGSVAAVTAGLAAGYALGR
ncbi:MAG TPA: prepilin peptidase [Acidimicrobiales bacterium]|nr:prepilin peptidase [Acidimicrobiales bacterium]